MNSIGCPTMALVWSIPQTHGFQKFAGRKVALYLKHF